MIENADEISQVLFGVGIIAMILSACSAVVGALLCDVEMIDTAKLALYTDIAILAASGIIGSIHILEQGKLLGCEDSW